MKRCVALILLAACTTSRPDDPSAEPDAAPSHHEPVIEENWIAHGATALAADDSDLYFASGPELLKVSVGGGTPQTIFTAAPSPGSYTQLQQLVIGATDLLFVEADQDENTFATTKTLYIMPKAGGAATALATSSDVRSFIGLAFDGNDVVYSSFTSVLRVPRSGGTVQLVGQSEGDTKYWIFSPIATPDSWVWASLGAIYRLPRTNTDKTGKPFAQLPETGQIISSGSPMVVALSPDIEGSGSYDAIATVDPATGATSARVPFGMEAYQVAVTSDDAWAATYYGLVRVPRAGGSPANMTTGFTMAVAASGNHVFTAGQAHITRITL